MLIDCYFWLTTKFIFKQYLPTSLSVSTAQLIQRIFAFSSNHEPQCGPRPQANTLLSKESAEVRITFPIMVMRNPAMKDDENIFDDDDALDYIIYKKMNKEHQGSQNEPGKTGCLGALALVVLPATVIGCIILNIVWTMKIRSLTTEYYPKAASLLDHAFAPSRYEVQLFDKLHEHSRTVHE